MRRYYARKLDAMPFLVAMILALVLSVPAHAAVPRYNARVNESNALELLKAYDPDGWNMVSYTRKTGSAKIGNWLAGQSGLAAALQTAVHEECHGYASDRGSYTSKGLTEAIYIGNGEVIQVTLPDSPKTFRTSEMAERIPKSLRTFRFDDYVSKNAKCSANLDGPWGLIDEFNAYSWGFNNQLNLFEYYVTDDTLRVAVPNCFCDFANECTNDINAYAEFRYWILRYLEYARTNHKDVYNYYINDRNFANAYCITQQRFESMIAEFEAKAEAMLHLARCCGYEVESVEDDPGSYYLWYNGTGIGIQLGCDDYNLLMPEINKSAYQAIDKALHKKATMSKTSLAAAMVSDIPTQAYSGSSLRPSVTVKLGGKALKNGIDYQLSYVNNLYLGTAGLVVAGRGKYVDGIMVQFEIADYPFVDTNGATPHLEDIIWLYDTKVSEGWLAANGTRTFRPYAEVKRGDMAAFLCRLARMWGLVDDDWVPSDDAHIRFVDVSEQTAHCEEIWWLADQGVTEGWELADGGREFRPNASVARCDMAAFLHRLAVKAGRGANDDGLSVSFLDVASVTAHSEEIEWLAGMGISQGWVVSGGSEFRPLARVKRCDMAAFLHRMDGVR